MATEIKIPKSYRYYKLSNLREVCGILKLDIENMLQPVQSIEPSDILQGVLKRSLTIPMLNEKARSELLVMPILSELSYLNKNFKPLSGIHFEVEKEKGLQGICDFLISNNPYVGELDVPVVCIFEAKDDSVDRWYGQCGAEMYAARLFNERAGNNINIIYGAVTNGITWQFLKLEGQYLYVDSQRYGIANLPQLLGAIQKVYNFYK
jgi:hypothetical protein